MPKYLTANEHRNLRQSIKTYRVEVADTTVKNAGKEKITKRSKAEHEIRKIVELGVKRGDSFDKIYRYCSVLKNHLGYDPKNYVKKLYDSYREAEKDEHEDR